MSKFIQLNKLTTATASHTSPIIVLAEAISLAQPLVIHNQETGISSIGTRITVQGTPDYSFTILEPLNLLAALLKAASPVGASFLGRCGVGPVIVSPKVNWPHILIDKVVNSQANLSEQILLNPNMIVWAEETFFFDDIQLQEVSGVTLTVASASRPIQTLMPFNDLASLLSPDVL